MSYGQGPYGGGPYGGISSGYGSGLYGAGPYGGGPTPSITLAPFPDIETMVMDLLVDLGTTGTEAPPNIEERLPFIRVNRIGGSDDRISDTARVDVDAFESSRPLALALAETIRQRLLGYPFVLDGGLIDRVVTSLSPQEVTWGVVGSRGASKGFSDIRRYVATNSVTARR